MEKNLGYIAIAVFILLSIVLMLIPKRTILKKIKMDINEAELKKDSIGYYRALFLVSGLSTIGIMLFVKYVIL